ncbi:MAG: CRISPR associated protein Cas10, large subunit of Type III system effector complex [Candidatus Methanohalarchaeum thermophilum]|uniref:CRISPR associated protein Cas10, large subunit of Type III system effector complex n=1 Tax=Methanohalarchaeum thermophilum TaxID=1903181 RepID=A0A1Q6DVB9_METT1|nr:MAG: CRISPR associated protein Cas10, large subunit of Type III system effector complex [Candidatus Methanohalarchaeum thermophilum]
MSEKSPQIKKLKQKKEDILLSEIGALIHDIGKLSEVFVESHSKEEKDSENSWVPHTAIFDFDIKNGEDDISKLAKDAKNALKNKTVEINNKENNLFIECVYGHHEKKLDGEEKSYEKPTPCTLTFPNKDYSNLHEYVGRADNFDSRMDKGNTNECQTKSSTFMASAFGKEESLDIKKLKKFRKTIYEEIIKLSSNSMDLSEVRSNLLDETRNKFSQTLGETKRAANDVSLWEHSYMTMTIVKALINETILNENHSLEKNSLVEDLKILSIGWNYFNFLSMSEKISDITGREIIIDKIKEKIIKKIETESLLGNKIYEDERGVHFLIPASLDEDEIKKDLFEIFNETIEGVILPKIVFSENGSSINQMLHENINNIKNEPKTVCELPSWYIDNLNLINKYKDKDDQNILVCNNCGKSLYKEGNNLEICSICGEKIREVKIDSKETKITDEIAWKDDGKGDYEGIGLFLLNFELEKSREYIKSLFLNKLFSQIDQINQLYKIEDEGLNLGAIKGWLNDKGVPRNKAKEEISEAQDRLEKAGLEKYSKRLSKKRDNKNEMKKFLKENDFKKLAKKQAKSLLEENTGSKGLSKKKEIIKNKSKSKALKELSSKRLSPSRQMRIWKNADSFFKKIKNVLQNDIGTLNRHKFNYKPYSEEESDQENIPFNQAIEVRFISKNQSEKGEVLFSEDSISTITPHVNEFIENNEVRKIKVIDDNLKNEREFSVEKRGTEIFKQFRIISRSPNQFLFLAPAEKTIKIMNSIKEKYEEELGKAYGKIPLNVGIVFGKRKTPMFSLIDSARRFRNVHENKNQNEVKSYEVVEVDGGENGDRVELGIIPESKKDVFDEREVFERSIQIPFTLGNGEVDSYHPYLRVKPETVENEENVLKVEVGGETFSQLHVMDINEGDVVKLDEANFDFEFLDSNIKRFNINKDRDHEVGKKQNSGPYSFEEWQKFVELGEIFGAIGRWKPLRDIGSLAAEKRIEWSDKEGDLGSNRDNYRKLVGSILENKFSKSDKKELKWDRKNNFTHREFLIQSILDGTFFDALKLFNSILDIKIEELKNISR